ncbi:hypothetical protein LguiA_017644 [Lonicera macranthoides]
MWSYSQQKSSRLCQNLKPIGVQEGLCLVLLERSLIDPIKIGGRSEFGKDSAFSDWYEEFLLLRKGSLVGTEDIAEESEEEEYVTEIDSYSALDPIGRMCKLFEENGSLSLLNERHNSQEVDRQPSSHSKEITTLFQTFQQSHTTIRGWGQLQVMMASIPT